MAPRDPHHRVLTPFVARLWVALWRGPQGKEDTGPPGPGCNHWSVVSKKLKPSVPGSREPNFSNKVSELGRSFFPR